MDNLRRINHMKFVTENSMRKIVYLLGECDLYLTNLYINGESLKIKDCS